MLKFIGLLALLTVFFGLGYYLGSGGELSLRRGISRLREEVSSKSESLHEEIAVTRVRMNLLEAKDHVLQAEKDLEEKNFGAAERELSVAEQRLGKATELAKNGQQKPLLHRLMPIAESLKETRNDVRHMDMKAKTKIAGLEKALDQMID